MKDTGDLEFLTASLKQERIKRLILEELVKVQREEYKQLLTEIFKELDNKGSRIEDLVSSELMRKICIFITPDGFNYQ